MILELRSFANVELQMNQAIEELAFPLKNNHFLAKDQRAIWSFEGKKG